MVLGQLNRPAGPGRFIDGEDDLHRTPVVATTRQGFGSRATALDEMRQLISEGVRRRQPGGVGRHGRETGETPGQYLQKLRVQRALSLLTTTADPLKTIAQAVGFASPTHLAGLIRRATGRRPGSFRQS
jgi:hypothetical protein